ncbi:carboxymuconolactone decarboxylase family protein [Frankia sp. CNm7]|uniref:Carboxymuconolactone decarboxylase family protein n=1 Tax=Frankia nepalensis TaxID=1836974 RepID=A0A937UQA9_9ACTN|nr:carboxymuconolactone decarboxylase family protein [Frankia nepalensis]MBL7501526.1 carboxymuconolactone decarboxylase family protein [Frankia nepalensis]MBL7515297.1 carboxymuconolactone decarboxylase family protein [Frankia nepalensis]MBL7523581.1 carboxymuconolactone decarboxylase family protein [Frankia nepalensis]MBL7630032.1 carboxymuconolactone decarboxylase family protein [Frankia nepalensis]
MTWLAWTARGRTPLDSVYGLLPEAYARHRELAEQLWRPGLVDPVVLELCRLRIARLLRCEPELAARTPAARAAGLTESKISRLADWPTAPGYSAAERAALAYAELFVIDPGAVTDELAADVTAYFTPPRAAALTLAIAVFDAIARFQVALEV